MIGWQWGGVSGGGVEVGGCEESSECGFECVRAELLWVGRSYVVPVFGIAQRAECGYGRGRRVKGGMVLEEVGGAMVVFGEHMFGSGFGGGDVMGEDMGMWVWVSGWVEGWVCLDFFVSILDACLEYGAVEGAGEREGSVGGVGEVVERPYRRILWGYGGSSEGFVMVREYVGSVGEGFVYERRGHV